jgi:hypothetical protein
VVVDEANRAFSRDLLDETQLKQAEPDLALFVRLTKQSLQVMVESSFCSTYFSLLD